MIRVQQDPCGRYCVNQFLPALAAAFSRYDKAYQYCSQSTESPACDTRKWTLMFRAFWEIDYLSQEAALEQGIS